MKSENPLKKSKISGFRLKSGLIFHTKPVGDKIKIYHACRIEIKKRDYCDGGWSGRSARPEYGGLHLWGKIVSNDKESYE